MGGLVVVVMGELVAIVVLGELVVVLFLGGLVVGPFSAVLLPVQGMGELVEQGELASAGEFAVIASMGELRVGDFVASGEFAVTAPMGEIAVGGSASIWEVATGESASMGAIVNDDGVVEEFGTCAFFLRLRVVRQFLLPLVFLLTLQ